MKILSFYILYSAILLEVFINDYFLFDFIPVFYIGWMIVVALRLFLKISISNKEVTTQVFLFSIILFPLVNEVLNSSNSYWHAYIFIVLSVNIILAIPYLLLKPKSLIQISTLWILLFFINSIISIIKGERAFIIFGPNTLYRIYAFIFISFCVASIQLKIFSIKNIFFISILIIYLISNVATLSRGSTVVTIATLLVLYSHNLNSIKKLLSSCISLLIIAYICLYFIRHNESVKRVLNFNVLGGSRADFLRNSYGLITELNFLGFSSENVYFPFPYYPHNIFAEAIIYSGWYTFCLLVVSYTCCIYNMFIPKKKVTDYSSVLLIGILIGSLFSGSLFDNYMIFSLGAVLISFKFTNLNGKNT